MSYFNTTTLDPASYGVASTGNSTVVPLTGAATFTGTAEDNDYPEVMVSCISDVAGTLYFDFSVDGTNWNTFPSSGFLLRAGIHAFHTASKGPRQFRVRLVNASGAQTYLRLKTYYGKFIQPMAPLNQQLSVDADAIATRPSSAQDEITLGRRAGATGWTKFAYRTNLTAATGEQLITGDNTTNTPTIITTASTFTIAYNNATDGLGQTGALKVTLYYLNSIGEAAIAEVTLTATGSDVTAFTGLGINRAVVSQSGSATYNTNAITITATTGGSVQAYIPALQAVTQTALFHVPTNARGAAKQLFLAANKVGGTSPVVVFKGYVFSRITLTRYEIFRYTMDTSTTNSILQIEPVNFGLSSGDVLYFVADTDINSTVAECRFSLNTYLNV